MDKDSILKAAVEAAENMSAQPQHSVMPQPVPTAVQLSSVRDNHGNQFVVLTLTTPVGQNLYFFDPDTAIRVSEGLAETARLARTGLEIAR